MKTEESLFIVLFSLSHLVLVTVITSFLRVSVKVTVSWNLHCLLLIIVMPEINQQLPLR